MTFWHYDDQCPPGSGRKNSSKKAYIDVTYSVKGTISAPSSQRQDTGATSSPQGDFSSSFAFRLSLRLTCTVSPPGQVQDSNCVGIQAGNPSLEQHQNTYRARYGEYYIPQGELITILTFAAQWLHSLSTGGELQQALLHYFLQPTYTTNWWKRGGTLTSDVTLVAIFWSARKFEPLHGVV